MGGFHLKTPDFKAFPLNADQLFYLVDKRYLDPPHIDVSQIRDKNKVDGMLRLVTAMQTIWFALTVVARAAQGLAITTFELTTVAFVMLSAATSVCWLSKPADVHTPHVLHSETTMAQILLDAGDLASKPSYYYTPLDFVSRREWGFSKLWSYGLDYCQMLHIAAQPVKRPIPRIQNTVVPPIEGWYSCITFGATAVYFLVFVAGWRFTFPTRAEGILWRVAVITAPASACCGLLGMHIVYTWLPVWKARQGSQASKLFKDVCKENQSAAPEKTRSVRDHHWFNRFLYALEGMTPMKDPGMRVPAELLAATWVIGITYFTARVYVFIADFIGLRLLPASAYQTVDWSRVIPHFG